MKYAMANARTKFRIASENTAKHSAIYKIIAHHPTDRILIIGMYIDQLKQLAAEMGAPLLTGSTGQKRRDLIIKAFKDGEIPVFYTIVSHNTREQDFALKRQLFLCEQGYEYHIEFPG